LEQVPALEQVLVLEQGPEFAPEQMSPPCRDGREHLPE
jgi:hypothetical protein